MTEREQQLREFKFAIIAEYERLTGMRPALIPLTEDEKRWIMLKRQRLISVALAYNMPVVILGEDSK